MSKLSKFAALSGVQGSRRPLWKHGTYLTRVDDFMFKDGTNGEFFKIEGTVMAVLDPKPAMEHVFTDASGREHRCTVGASLQKGTRASQILKPHAKHAYLAMGELSDFLRQCELARGLSPEDVEWSLGVAQDDGTVVGFDSGDGDTRSATEKYCDPKWFAANVAGKVYLLTQVIPGNKMVTPRPGQVVEEPVFMRISWMYDAETVQAFLES